MFSQVGKTQNAASIIEQVEILPTYDKLLTRWLDHLVELGDLVRVDDGYVCVGDGLAERPLSPLLTSAQTTLADVPELLTYVQRCGEQLPDILTGKTSALETIFPGGSYRNSRFSLPSLVAGAIFQWHCR